MEMFSASEVARLREKAKKYPEYVEALDTATADLRRKLYIQKTGKATWSHYYVCPDCGVRLIFDYDDPHRYQCPACKNYLTGEPYEGSWWDTVMVMNSGGAYKLAVLYTVTEDEKYFRTAADILLGYAENYKNFEVHGNIPYNHPGRFASQVLSDAGPLAELACAYALLKSKFTAEERRMIENDLFREASKHQIKYSTDQIHNHEVVICSSLGIMGLVIGDEDILHFAVERKYGLKYQLDNAVLEDGLWFECATGYHSYALSWLLRFDQMARGTKYSLMADPHYREILERMIRFLLNLATPAGYPFFNDAATQLAVTIYEYAYSIFGDKDILRLLHECYDDCKRNNLYALLFGVDELPEREAPTYKNYFSTTGSQLAVLNGESTSLWFKAMPYGGEHDHYDRLAVAVSAFGKQICSDLGTAAGYGAPLHYAYYKNTASHNTVIIDGENMPPCNTQVVRYEQTAPDRVYLEARTETTAEYVPIDSFVIKQWNDEAYEGVRYRRIVSWHDRYMIDVFCVESENDLRKEWCWHTVGTHSLPEGVTYVGKISERGAQSFLHDAYSADGKGVMRIAYDCGECRMSIHADAEGKEMLLSYGPNNPSTGDIAYLLERSYDRCPVYANVIDFYRDEPNVLGVEYIHGEGSLTVRVTEKDGSIAEETFNI